MNEKTKSFRIILPAELSKSKDGDWIVQGLASSATRDQQGEVILQDGMDLSPIDKKKGFINMDHGKGPENTIGLLDSYRKDKAGLFVKGRLFKKHKKAQAVHEIMSSLGKSDVGRVGLSVEGKILERAGKDGKTIKKCRIHGVAITLCPVNTNTYVDLVKSMTTSETEIDFQATDSPEADARETQEAVFTSSQVMQLIEKALSVGGGYTEAPASREGGDALSQEDLDKKVKQASPKKRLKRMNKALYKSNMAELLVKIQELYPNSTRSELWESIKDRLHKKFPEIRDSE